MTNDECAAGSRCRAVRMSSSARARGFMPSVNFCLVHQVRVEHRGEVALTERGDDRDDQLALVLGTLANLDGGVDGCAGGDANEQALLAGGCTGRRNRSLGVNVEDL